MKQNKQTYKIHWKSLKTGETGQGTENFPLKQAQMICNELNKQDKNIVTHWLEPSKTQPELPNNETVK